MRGPGPKPSLRLSTADHHESFRDDMACMLRSGLPCRTASVANGIDIEKCNGGKSSQRQFHGPDRFWIDLEIQIEALLHRARIAGCRLGRGDLTFRIQSVCGDTHSDDF